MSITIQEAIKAMNEGKVVRCISSTAYFKKEDLNTADPIYIKGNMDFSDYRKIYGQFATYEIKSSWEIVEQEEQPKPCLWCGGHTRVVQFSNFDKYKEIVYFKIICDDKYIHECDASSPSNIVKLEAIRKHNEIYRKLHGEKKESENLKNDIKEVYEWLTENLQYISTAYERDYKSGALDRIKSMMHLMETYFRNIINKDK